jgi:hypothetical protein
MSKSNATKLWCLTVGYGDISGCEMSVLGVYSSKELAEKARDKWLQVSQDDSYGEPVRTLIEELELDE